MRRLALLWTLAVLAQGGCTGDDPPQCPTGSFSVTLQPLSGTCEGIVLIPSRWPPSIGAMEVPVGRACGSAVGTAQEWAGTFPDGGPPTACASFLEVSATLGETGPVDGTATLESTCTSTDVRCMHTFTATFTGP